MNPCVIDQKPLTLKIREARRSLRATVYAVIALFINALVAPDVFAIQDGMEKANQAREIVLSGSPEQKLNQALVKLQEQAKEANDSIADRLASESGFMDAVFSFLGMSRIQLEDIDQIKTLEKLIKEQHKAALKGFNETESALKRAKVSDEIMQRHYNAQRQYESTYADMMARLEQVVAADNLREQGDAVKALNALMEGQKLKKTHQSVDPENLPWGTPDASKTRKPAETARELSQVTGIPNHPQATIVAANVITPDMLGKPGGPVAEDLAETIDVQLTDAIQAKALELGEDPVEIYNWVRNNIEFIPSYGSIQGADYTLRSGRGNAFDTASLLIALLRASNIPARYAYGTVEIPAEKVMNWVGGVNVPEAAQQLLGQGGIPNVALVSGGKVTHIKLEHVWVEVWVDYFPGRAAKHKIGDTWVPLDASFKQYEFTQRVDLRSEAGIDGEALLSSVMQSGSSSGSDDYVQGIDQAALNEGLGGFSAQLESLVDNVYQEELVEDLIGKSTAIKQEPRELAAGLPYTLSARTNSFSEIPSRLRHKFRYTLGTEYYGREDRRLISFEKPTPELAGKTIALSFEPASEADRETMEAYLPEKDSGTGQIDPAGLPTDLPGHLVHLKASLLLDGELELETSDLGSMGTELYETISLFSPSFGWEQAENHIVAGEYQAVGLSLQGDNHAHLSRIHGELDQTESILRSGSQDQIATLDQQQVFGNLMTETVLSYLSLNAVQDEVQGKLSDVLVYHRPSFGKFSTRLEPSYFFGIPRNVRFSGLVMDVDRLAVQVSAKDNSSDKRVGFMKSAGARASAMEHLVPESMFSRDGIPVAGVSAVKALSLAARAGQKLWSVDSSNVDAALASVTLAPSIESEIRTAVWTGKEATIHESPVAYGRGEYVGYIILDPQTGAGAYKIGGGENGGIVETDSFLSKFLFYFSSYGIQLSLTELVGLLLFGSIPKSWVGTRPLLGSKNPLTSVMRGLYRNPLAKMFLMRLVFIPAFTLLGVFVGFFNFTTIILALIYAI